MPQIEVTFDIDANARNQRISLKDKDTGKRQQIRIQHHLGLSDEEVQIKWCVMYEANADADLNLKKLFRLVTKR